MGINIYNDNEKKLSETLNALKELPKVNAPDDFEFNLMIKITNGEFEPEAEEKRQSKLLWILTPAALVVTAVILFVTFSKSELDQQLTPLQNQGSIYAGKVGDSASKTKITPKLAENQASRKKLQNRIPDPVRPQNNNTDPAFPFMNEYSYSQYVKDRSFKLDNLLKDKNKGNADQTYTAKTEVGQAGDLLLKDENLQNNLNDKKAVKDSLKKMQSKNDSPKLKKNIKR